MSSIYSWSETASANDIADTTIDWREGQMPDTVNNSARAMMARVAEWLADQGGALTTGGVVNVYTLTANSPFTALEDGLIVAFKASVTNTAAATINVNATGSKAIRRIGDTADVDIEAGTVVSGQVYVARYSTSANAGAGAWMLVNAPTRALNLANSTGAIADVTAGKAKLEVRSAGADAAFISFNRQGTFASYYGIDTDNKWKVGGQSLGANAYEVYHAGNREIPLNTISLFYQAAAPVGWTKVIGANNYAIRVTDGAGGGNGGSVGFTTVFGQATTGGHSITIPELPVHSHANTLNDTGHAHTPANGHTAFLTHQPGVGPFSTGAGSSVQASDASTASATTGISINNATAGSGAAHVHPMDMRVQYIDVILCQRTT